MGSELCGPRSSRATPDPFTVGTGFCGINEKASDTYLKEGSVTSVDCGKESQPWRVILLGFDPGFPVRLSQLILVTH